MRVLVIPCFNEEHRLVESEVLRCVEILQCTVLLVNDGSRDKTLDVIEAIAALQPDLIRVQHLAKNVGKGEAVRSGVQLAMSLGATEVGFCDADFSVNATDLLRLFDQLDSMPRIDAVIGSRMAISGSNIERSLIRHISGRVFATLVSFTLHQRIYDTQCGAKIFRVCNVVKKSFSEPFVSRWAFDVEIIGRIYAGNPQTAEFPSVVELPLLRWIAQPGSKLSLGQQLITVFDLLRIRRSLQTLK
jgi:glycosyltransferase involved in cell wall biosynthesis